MSKMTEELKKFLREHPEEAKKTWEEVKSMNLPDGPLVKDFLKIQKELSWMMSKATKTY